MNRPRFIMNSPDDALHEYILHLCIPAASRLTIIFLSLIWMPYVRLDILYLTDYVTSATKQANQMKEENESECRISSRLKTMLIML